MHIPLTVPQKFRAIYQENMAAALQGKERLLLFAGDQKIEHLNKDFYGPGIAPEDNDPEHLFRIASQAPCGLFAAQLGLIAQYGAQYPAINYLVKLNGKTDFVPTAQADPVSRQLWSIEEVMRFKEDSDLQIRAVGYTLYVGSEHESIMMHEAARIITQAHQHGLLVVLWVYPRGKAVAQPDSADAIAGAAGVACALGADFAKVFMPLNNGKPSYEALRIAAQAAGKTKLLVSGGKARNEQEFLDEVRLQIQEGNAGGIAVGRNIHQRSLADAKALCVDLEKILGSL